MPPKHLRSSVVSNAAQVAGTNKLLTQLSERISLLEMRYSTVLVHQTYFKILDEWLQLMFGAELFPKTKDAKKENEKVEEEDFTDNPFYELHMLHQRVKLIEDELQSMGIDIPQFKPVKPQPPPISSPNRPTTRRSYGAPVFRKRPFIEEPAPNPPPLLKPMASSGSARKISREDGTGGGGGGAEEKEKGTPAVKEKEKEETSGGEDDKEKPPILEEQVIKKEIIQEDEDEEMEEIPPPPTPTSEEKEKETTEKGTKKNSESSNTSSAPTTSAPTPTSSSSIMKEVEIKVEPEAILEEMEEEEDEEDEEDEDYEQKVDIDDIEYVVGRRAERRARGVKGEASSSIKTRGSATNTNNGGGGADSPSSEQQSVTYTTRGRRHTLPRRYAEFTGHDNVASILKSQQRASVGAAKGKKKLAAAAAERDPETREKEPKQKTPSKPKPPPKQAPTPKKTTADGSRPECVYNLITEVQNKEVDEQGNCVLWDPIPSVKVNQQHLISVIFRSNGMATRLTRKLTTLVFEDQVLANTSPFGTKYYQERLPPEPLEAMVEFISHSGFDADYTKKKIYMVVGQVCNEARAGRVRKVGLVPSSGGGGGPSSSSGGLGAPSSTATSTSSADVQGMMMMVDDGPPDITVNAPTPTGSEIAEAETQVLGEGGDGEEEEEEGGGSS